MPDTFHPPVPPLFVLFEGADGVGKTTQRDRLAEWLRGRRRDVVCLAEPTDGPWGRRIREAARADTRPKNAMEEVRWFVEDRREDVERNIKPALAAGRDVLLDRYYYSTAAYQGARGVPIETILQLNRAFAPEPDLILLLRLDPDEARRRIERDLDRGHGPDAFEVVRYQQAVGALFEQLVTRDDPARGPVAIIDAAASIDDVHRDIVKALTVTYPGLTIAV